MGIAEKGRAGGSESGTSDRSHWAQDAFAAPPRPEGKNKESGYGGGGQVAGRPFEAPRKRNSVSMEAPSHARDQDPTTEDQARPGVAGTNHEAGRG